MRTKFPKAKTYKLAYELAKKNGRSIEAYGYKRNEHYDTLLENGLKAVDVAKMLKVSSCYISKVLRGKKNLSEKVKNAIFVLKARKSNSQKAPMQISGRLLREKSKPLISKKPSNSWFDGQVTMDEFAEAIANKVMAKLEAKQRANSNKAQTSDAHKLVAKYGNCNKAAIKSGLSPLTIQALVKNPSKNIHAKTLKKIRKALNL